MKVCICVRSLIGTVPNSLCTLTNLKNLGIHKNHHQAFDMNHLFQRTVANIIGSTAFGLKLNSLKDENEFFENTHSAIDVNIIQILKFLAIQSIPNIMHFLKIPILHQKHAQYFRNMIRQNMNYREEHNIFRPDMIQMLMEAKKGSLQHDTKNDDIGFATVHESEYGKASIKHMSMAFIFICDNDIC